MDKICNTSLKITEDNITKLNELFPSVVEDGKIDFELLRTLLGDAIEDKKEKYQFTWPGKSDSIRIAQIPSSFTLCPCKEKSKDWNLTQNLYIEGDNLEVLKQLQKTYFGKIKMIYIDPPYNTGSDLIYDDSRNEKVDSYLERTNQSLSSNPKTNGRYHTNWLNLMYPRLLLARNLLSTDGFLFVSIDENEISNMYSICDEVFGENNRLGCITWNKRVPKNDNKGIGNISEYVLVYSKSTANAQKLVMKKEGIEEIKEFIDGLKKKHVPIPQAEKELQAFYNSKGYDRGITLYNNLDENYEPWGKINVSWPNGDTFGPRYDVLHPATHLPTKVPDRGWRWNEESFNKKLDYTNVIKRYDGSYICGEIWFASDERTQPSSIKYLKDVNTMLLRSIISLKSDGGIEVEKIFDGKSYFSYPKPVSLCKLLIESIESKNGIYLDFFSGSATTAHAVMQLNAEDGGSRRFIMVQLPELCDEKSEAYKAGYRTICDIGEERIRRAGEKIKKEWEEKNRSAGLFAEDKEFPVDIGFKVFKLDSTNIRPWDNENELDEETLFTLDNVFKEGRTKEDVLYEIMLKYGIFDQPVTAIDINGKTMYRIGRRHMIVCLEDDVTEKDINAIGKLSPRVVVFKEAGFKDDNQKINAEYNLKKAGIEDVKCV